MSGVIERNARAIDINLFIAIFLLDRHHPGVSASTNKKVLCTLYDAGDSHTAPPADGDHAVP